MSLVAALVPYRWRRVHHRYAAWFGYFWLPCPLCGHEFGGHELRDVGALSSSIPATAGDGHEGICPPCTRAGRGASRWDRAR